MMSHPDTTPSRFDKADNFQLKHDLLSRRCLTSPSTTSSSFDSNLPPAGQSDLQTLENEKLTSAKGSLGLPQQNELSFCSSPSTISERHEQSHSDSEGMQSSFFRNTQLYDDKPPPQPPLPRMSIGTISKPEDERVASSLSSHMAQEYIDKDKGDTKVNKDTSRRVSSHTRAVRKIQQQPRKIDDEQLQRLRYIEGTLVSSVNKKQIYTCQWPTAGTPRALVFICHGFGEHVGRYKRHVPSFISQGIMLLGNDHQGHGRSQGDRGDIARFSTYAKDLVQFIEMTVSTYKSIPVFIWGVGMGGAIALNIARYKLFDVRGFLLCGPLVMPDPRASTYFKRKLASALSYVAPKFNIGTIDPTMLCNSEFIGQQWAMDELNYHGTIRVRWANVTMRAAEENCLNLKEMDYPFICMQGMCDEIVIADGASELFDRATCKDKTLIMFEGCGHEIHNEFSTNDIVDDLVIWTLERIERLKDDVREEIVKFIPASVTHPTLGEPVDLDSL
eukprot:CFRG1241T1